MTTRIGCGSCIHHIDEHAMDDLYQHGQCKAHGCTCLLFKPVFIESDRKPPETVRIRIEKLLFKPNAVSGMNVLVVMSQTYFYRAGVLDGVPIVVKREGENYRILDGRHRVVASLLAGRPDVLAVIEE